MRKLFILIISILALYIAGCGGDKGSNPPPPPVPTVRLVVDTTAAPGMTNVNAGAWNSVESVMVEIGSGSDYGLDADLGHINVNLKAIKKNDTLYLRAKWQDATANIWGNYMRPLPQVIDWEQVTSAGDDRFFVMFDAGDNGTEKADCSKMCHATSMKPTNGHADVINWSATSTAPGFMADDEWWNNVTGRLFDNTVNAYVYRDNWNSFSNVPYYMHKDTIAFLGPYLYLTDTVAMNYATIQWPSNYRMPGYRIDSTIYNSPSRSSYSRWDVRAISQYDSTSSPHTWTIVMSRALNTGHIDDVNLALAGFDSVQVTIAAANAHSSDPVNASWQHSGSKPFYLILKR
ncbi:hypothetical protein TRIP_C60492 [Candidatus Zixiibacteriota bacterium]|nr:hypothetical protein TRIP_C60492 [candidate division Zixibacteria bacterium]